MRIASLEIRRNTYGFATEILGRAAVQPDQVVGLVKLKGADGAEVTLPLTDGQIADALAAIAGSATVAARDLGSTVHAGMFQPRPALEHAPSDLVAAPVPAGWGEVEAGGEAPAVQAPVGDDAPQAENPPAFAAGQVWRTRSGQSVELLEVGFPGVELHYPIRGRIEGAHYEEDAADLWDAGGRYYTQATDDRDLVAYVGTLATEPANAVG